MTAPTEAEIRAADAEYWEYIAGLLRVTGGGPVTVARAADERRELLRLLDEARAERDAAARERDDWRARFRATEGDPWRWMGDGTDDIESLVCPVLIAAEDLRKIIAETDGARALSKNRPDV